ncbi:hypothetical protein FACS189473_3170 [Spirochaetia bacterium]|nr:hypothetical protein FACS189473_3170 [Spirochaetia bacterium]
MNFVAGLKRLVLRGVNILSGKAALVLHRPHKSVSPLVDRLLADALRLAELPSPAKREERRGAFVTERLISLGLNPTADEQGNILVRLSSTGIAAEPPLLLFADLGSRRWHLLESLSRLDAQTARGAGLADSLGAAALLSLAESAGRLAGTRDLLLFFAARSPDDPAENLFCPIIENPENRPFAGIGLRGFELGKVTTQVRGLYRMKITLSAFSQAAGGPDRSAAEHSTAVINSLLSTAQMLSGITWDTEGTTHLHIRRIEAAAAFGKTPAEGVLEIELESTDGKRLDMAMNTVKATVEKAAAAPGLKAETRITSSIPVGDAAVIAPLSKTVMAVMKEQRIKIREEDGTDLSAFLSLQGIPAISVGLAAGREERGRDTIEIASIGKGRALLEALAARLADDGTKAVLPSDAKRTTAVILPLVVLPAKTEMLPATIAAPIVPAVSLPAVSLPAVTMLSAGAP